MKSQKL